MSTYTYREVLNQIQHLTPDEQFQLLEDLVALVRRQATSGPQKHSIMELKGFGQESVEGYRCAGIRESGARIVEWLN